MFYVTESSIHQSDVRVYKIVNSYLYLLNDPRINKILSSLYLKVYIQNLVKNSSVFLGKAIFHFDM